MYIFLIETDGIGKDCDDLLSAFWIEYQNCIQIETEVQILAFIQDMVFCDSYKWFLFDFR